jgi:hypothetical protein
MPKYDERFAQEAQEEEYLRLKHLDDEYWYAKFAEELRIKEPAFVAMAVNTEGVMVMVREHSEDRLHQVCSNGDLHILAVYQPKQFI